MTILTKDNECNAVVTAADGTQVEISASRLYDLGLAHWQGWQCGAGQTMLFIDHDFTVYGGQCRNDCLGNLFNSNFAIFHKPTTCRRVECTPCESDLYIHKQKPPFDH